MKRVIEMSMQDLQKEIKVDYFLIGNGFSPGVNEALENGFSIEQAFEAESVVGSNTEMILTYLMQNYSNGFN